MRADACARAFSAAFWMAIVATSATAQTASERFERVAEWTIESRKAYANPFQDVDIDVVFEKDGQKWRVPTFWRGGQKWTVRFAPPAPGIYSYSVQSTDAANAHLNGQRGRVTVTAYNGANQLLRRGSFRVSANKRHLEHADGTPFFWLGDTWWTGLSDRLSWDGFKMLTSDRKAKGFTVVQLVGGLIPSNEEKGPSDPGFCNEGGCVYDPQYHRINPQYFDYADRRIELLVDNEIAPAIVGAWRQMGREIGAEKLKKHWRYLIARYGAYPVFWIIGGEVTFLPRDTDTLDATLVKNARTELLAWEEVARYVRSVDPYRHPGAIHESNPPFHGGFQDLSLTDFDLIFPSHAGWPTVATGIAQLNLLYARKVTKPAVIGEIGYEGLGGEHLYDFQRMAFWLSMLNGAAGYTYGTIETAEAYTTSKPLHRYRWSFATWEEAMQRPGSTQVGINARLLRQFPWQRFTPHPEWITPRGKTLFETTDDVKSVDVDVSLASLAALEKSTRPQEDQAPTGAWQQRPGTFRAPYAAGIPNEMRVIYTPYMGVFQPGAPTVLNLEPNIEYRAYYWEPTLGIKIDLGKVVRSEPGTVLFKDPLQSQRASSWATPFSEGTQQLSLLQRATARNLTLSIDIDPRHDTALVFRYQADGRFVAARYLASEKAIVITQHARGDKPSNHIKTSVTSTAKRMRLIAELRDEFAVVSVDDGQQRTTSPIVSLRGEPESGRFGVLHTGRLEDLRDFEARDCAPLAQSEALERRLVDIRGTFRGELRGTPEWESYGKRKIVLLDAYRPERPPFPQDWLLVLDARPQ
jgi:hypothetical protein